MEKARDIERPKQMIRKYLLICVLIILLVDALAWANFTYPKIYRSRTSTPRYGRQAEYKSTESFPVELFSVVIEAFLFAVILRRMGFDPQRIFCVWLPITFVTIMLLDMFILSSAFIFKWDNTSEIIKQSQWNGAWALTVGIGEFFVIIYEALALRTISSSSFFYRKRSGPLEARQALILSTTVNLGLLFIGFLPFYFYYLIRDLLTLQAG